MNPDSALALGTQLLQQVQNPFFGVITDPTSPLAGRRCSLGRILFSYTHSKIIDNVGEIGAWV